MIDRPAPARRSPRNTLHEDAATALLGNAISLYNDARLLFDNTRYPTCTSLSILSVEELAKFMALVGLQPLPLKEWRNHIAKHVSPAGFLLRKHYQTALRDALSETPADEREATYSRLADMDYSDSELTLFDAILARLVSDFSLENFSQASAKDLDQLKQSGFYVDTDAQMHIRSTPSQVTRETAQLRLQYVRDLLAAVRAHL